MVRGITEERLREILKICHGDFYNFIESLIGECDVFLTDHDLIEEAERYAEIYDGDERQDIKTDVLKAFYHGSHYQKVNHQWKDISSAPKDRRILVWNIIHGVYESQCIPAHEGQVRDEWPHLCWSFPGAGDLKNDPTLKPEITTYWPGPTHWMELPNPPEEK